MNTWTIEPGLGVGPVRLGASRAEIRRTLGVSCIEQFDGGKPEWPIDFFKEIDELSVCYASDQRCVAIILWPPMDLVLDGLHVFVTPFPRLKTHLLGRDSDCRVNRRGVESKTLGVFFNSDVAADVTDEEREISNVVVFAPGYYD